MQSLSTAFSYLRYHWTTVVAVCAAALSFLGTLKNVFAGDQKVETVIDHVMDVLSWVARPGMQGVFGRASLPGVPSRPVKDPAVIPLILAFLGACIVLQACATPGVRALTTCELGQLPTALETVVADVAGALAVGGDGWETKLEALGRTLLPGQLDCVVSSIVAAWAGKAGATVAAEHSGAVQRGQIWLAGHRTGACRDTGAGVITLGYPSRDMSTATGGLGHGYLIGDSAGGSASSIEFQQGGQYLISGGGTPPTWQPAGDVIITPKTGGSYVRPAGAGGGALHPNMSPNTYKASESQ